MRRAVLAVAAATLVVVAEGAAGQAQEARTVDTVLAACPPAAEIAAIDARLSIAFEVDPSAGTLVCTRAAGSADLTRLRERTYQALRVMQALSFSRPLQWTSLSLYDWFTSAARGIRYRGDIQFSFCCDPARVINIGANPNLTALLTDRWVDPRFGSSGLDSLVALFVHEARHTEGPGHTCGFGDDANVPELGSWGVQYYLYLWEGLYSGSFLDAPAPDTSYYRESAIRTAESLLTRFCTVPSANLSLAVAAPTEAPVTSRVTYAARIANAGPEAARDVFLHAEVPSGARFASASPSRGSCVGPPAGATGPIGCSLGSIGAGDAATVEIELDVIALPGETVAPSGSAWGLRVTAPVRDTSLSDNSASPALEVVTLAACPPIPGPGGVYRIGTAGADALVGTANEDVICGGAGNDRLSGLAGDDALRGDAGNDWIAGGGGADDAEGGGGNDVISVGPGADDVAAGRGNDVVQVRDGTADRVSCGPGRDVVVADRHDRAGRDCEQVRRR